MHNLSVIEECYKKYIKRLYFWLPEDILFINLEILNQLDLLHFKPTGESKESKLTPHFYVIESSEKITLINDEFVIWIIPDRIDHIPMTYTLIAINQEYREPQLELAFIASGIYNNSKLVLRILEKFLIDIRETEGLLSKFKERT